MNRGVPFYQQMCPLVFLVRIRQSAAGTASSPSTLQTTPPPAHMSSRSPQALSTLTGRLGQLISQHIRERRGRGRDGKRVSLSSLGPKTISSRGWARLPHTHKEVRRFTVMTAKPPCLLLGSNLRTRKCSFSLGEQSQPP